MTLRQPHAYEGPPRRFCGQKRGISSMNVRFPPNFQGEKRNPRVSQPSPAFPLRAPARYPRGFDEAEPMEREALASTRIQCSLWTHLGMGWGKVHTSMWTGSAHWCGRTVGGRGETYLTWANSIHRLWRKKSFPDFGQISRVLLQIPKITKIERLRAFHERNRIIKVI